MFKQQQTKKVLIYRTIELLKLLLVYKKTFSNPFTSASQYNHL